MNINRPVIIGVAAAILMSAASLALQIRSQFKNGIQRNEDQGNKSSQKTEKKNSTIKTMIEASEFRLIDTDGNCLAKLAVEEDNSIDAMLETPPIHRAVLEMGSDPNKIRVTKNGIEIKGLGEQASLERSSLSITNKARIYLYAGGLDIMLPKNWTGS